MLFICFKFWWKSEFSTLTHSESEIFLLFLLSFDFLIPIIDDENMYMLSVLYFGQNVIFKALR